MAADKRNALLRAVTELVDQGVRPADGMGSRDRLSRAKGESLDDTEIELAQVLDRLGKRLEHHQQRESEMMALQETVLDLGRSRESDVVLRAIVHRARLLVRADFCYLSLLEQETGAFFAKVNEGATSPVFASLSMSATEGVLGHVVQSKAPFFTSDYARDDRIVHNPLVDDAMGREGIVSLLGVPLLIQGRLVGVFFVADRSPRVYQPQEISVLASLASHAALALENARLLEEARDANQTMERQRSEVVAAANAHEQMTELVARGGSVDDLGQLIAEVLDAWIGITDPSGRVISSIGREPAGAVALNERDLMRLLNESRAVGRSCPLADAPQIRGVAVTGGGELLGGLIVRSDDEINGPQIRTLERGAIVMGIVLLSQERVALRGYAEANELLAALFSPAPGDMAHLSREARRLGLDLTRPPTLFLLDWRDKRPAHALTHVRTALRRRNAFVGEIAGRIVVFAASADAEKDARNLCDTLRLDGGEPVNIAVSEPTTSLGEVRLAYEACSRLLRLKANLGEAGVISPVSRLSVYALLFDQQGRGQIQEFVRATIGPLVSRDKANSSDLVRTLLTFIDNGHAVRTTAEILGIHVNTLRQRIDTVRTLLGDWDEPTRRFEIHAALRLQTLDGL